MNIEEKKIVESVIEDFKARQAARKPFELAWQLNINFLMGNQYCSLGYGGSIEESERKGLRLFRDCLRRDETVCVISLSFR